MRSEPSPRAFRSLFFLAPAGMMLRSLASGHPLGEPDLSLLFYPFWSYLGQSLRHGRLPLWDPQMHAGLPFLASLQSQCLYPPAAILVTLLPLHAAAFVYLFGHLYWAGFGTEKLGRRLGLSAAAATSAGALVACAPILFSSIPRPNMLSAASWLPWTVLAADRACRGERRGVPALAICVGLGLLCASPEVTLLAVLASGAIAVFHAARGERWAMPRCALGGVLGVGLVSVSLFPFLELLRHSTRGGDLHGLETAWSLRGGDFAALFLPFVSLDARWGSFEQIFFGPYQGLLSVVYLGMPAAILAGAAVVRGGRRERALLGVVALALLLGAFGGEGSLLLEKLHVGAAGWRYPIKFIYPACFAVALLAALGAERVARAEPGRALAVLAALGGASLLGAMAIGQRQLGVALSIAWVAEGLLSLAAILRWVPLGPWRQWALVAFCAADAVLCSFRVPLQDDGEGCGAFLAGAAARLGGGRLDAVSGTALVHGLGFTLPGSGLANVCLLGDRPAQYGLPSIRFYGTPAPAGVQSVLDRLGATGDGLLGATLLLRSGPSAVPGLVPIAAPELAPLWAATIPDAAPRVELRPTARVSADVEGDTARETLAEARREVLLDEPPPPPSAAGAPSAGPEAATLTADEGERVVVDTASTGERWLVLADLYYPGWVATVDGVPAPIRRAYGMIRAVRLGPGRHRVVFDYRPASVRVGALVSLLAAMALILSLRGLSPPRPRLDLEMRAKG